ncbi:hypothetical protein HJC23_001952 [Cyclotella cryptica]|uniref:Myb-like domain-containing protein n=1 Tax=Cyclotella cryptica TaxID=29204 RepID=A0ABD3PP89_9STRA|eukprot:CCRYP_012924-RA/>CCRYP_012924-RA protein AED:0.13 eAED:0.13 QI:0/-1/0/1/-1/1/1/0/482
MNHNTDLDHHDDDDNDYNDYNDPEFPTTQTLTKWRKGVPDPSDDRINHWSLNGFGEPVFTGGLYSHSEIRTLETTLKDYCASKNVTPAELCSERHYKAVRGAWHEIAQCLPHRTVLSVYRRALRQFAGHARGDWSEEEVATLSRLVEVHGQRWKAIQNEMGRSAHSCRSKFYELDDEFERGKWSTNALELLLRSVRDVLRVPRDGMDVREINQWTLENHTKIPWTMVSFRVRRRRLDCYFKWRSMTKRSNRLAVAMGLEPVPMARCTLKFDAKMEYYQWKAEQDPKWREKFAQTCIMPLLRDTSDGTDTQLKRDDMLLGSIIESKASRPSEVPWNNLRYMPNGMSSRERFDHLVDTLAPEDALDLPLWELAKVVKGALAGFASAGRNLTETPSSGHAKKRKPVDRATRNDVAEPSSESNAMSAFNIPGIDRDAVCNKIKEIIASANCDELTVKGVRKILEKWLGMRLAKYQHDIKALIVEVM